MEGKIIAIIIAAVVVAGGAGTATAIILMNNDDGGDNYGVDTVRTDLKVGDYMKFKIDTHMTHEGSAAGYSREAMLNDIYYVDTVPAQAIHHNITYKGSTVVCNEYVYNDGDMIVYASEDTEFIYQITITHKDGRKTYTLSDTNLDLSKDYGSQTISSGSFVLYDYEMVVAHSTGTCTGTYKLWMEDFNGSNGTYWDSDDRIVDLEITYEITSVNSETNMIKIKGDDDEHPASWYLRYISKDQFTKYFEEVLGQKLTWDEKHESVIYPTFGKRDVTSQMVTANFGMMDAVQYNLTYGEEGVIYYYTTLSMYSILEGMQMELTSSSLISKK